MSLIQDQFDVDLVDHALLAEVELTAGLIVAASQSEAPLSLAEIDRILGVTLAPAKHAIGRVQYGWWTGPSPPRCAPNLADVDATPPALLRPVGPLARDASTQSRPIKLPQEILMRGRAKPRVRAPL